MERVTECLVTKDEREVIAVVLSPGPLDPQHPTGVSLVPKAPMTHGLLNNSSVAQAQDRERPELTRWLFCGQGIHAERGECPTSAMHIGVSLRVLRADWDCLLLCKMSVGSTNARPRPLHPIDETDTLAAVPFGTPIWASGGAPQGAPSAPTYTFQSLPIIPAHPIPTSEGHDGAAPSREGEHPCKAENSALVRLAHSRVALFHSISAPYSVLCGAVRNNFGISALLGLEIGENSLTASKPHSCTSFLNGFSSDPVCAVTPAPECSVFFFGVGLRLPMTITPTLGPLCDFSAYLLVYVPHRGFSHEGAPLISGCPLPRRAIRGMFGCGARGYTNTGKNWCYALEGLAPVHAPCGVAQGGPVCSSCLEWVLAHQDICLMRQNHHTSTIRVGLCWGSVMLDVSCLLASTDAFLSVGSSDSTRHLWGATPTHAGDTVECVPPLSCLMLVLALRHAHSQHQDGYP
ncbi:hypothetical protein PAPYR_12029 [Paratrimastix pyriformis]|uniref:Uncharacterized protein n=1 Tax=Paratrimastix pyriformis TaxID=342808 RepID=A0ABQ8U2M4_9EUKA|nr:hypothetical protein PAPYR_12029 [Paratrimastix pyriformis]